MNPDKQHSGFFLLLLACALSGCVSTTTDYRISVPSLSEKSVRGEVYHRGIARIDHEQFQAFLRPANEIQTGYGATFFFFIPTNKKIDDGKFHFTDSQYYREAVAENLRPENFVIEVFLNPKAGPLNFKPAECSLRIGTETVKVSRHSVVRGAVSQHPAVKDGLQRPGPYERFLFQSADLRRALESPAGGGETHEVSEGTGFVLEFDRPAPVPGAEKFTLALDGLSEAGIAIPALEIHFDQSREIARDIDL